MGGQGTSDRNFLEYNGNLAGKNGVVNINNNLVYERWSNEKFPQAKLTLFTPAEGQTLTVNVNNNLFVPDTVCAVKGGTESLPISGAELTTVSPREAKEDCRLLAKSVDTQLRRFGRTC